MIAGEKEEADRRAAATITTAATDSTLTIAHRTGDMCSFKIELANTSLLADEGGDQSVHQVEPEADFPASGL